MKKLPWPICDDDLRDALLESHAQNKCTEQLGAYFLSIAKNYTNKPNFVRYSVCVKEDLVSSAVLNLVQKWKQIDVISPDAKRFSYISVAVHNSFLAALKRHYRQENIKQGLREELGIPISWAEQGDEDA